jgi:lipopolysaccharide export system protein LptA
LFAVLFFTGAVLFKTVAAHADNTAEDTKTNTEKIHITSNTLIADNKAMSAEFIGNVVAVRGNHVITSDSLKIFYKKKTDEEEKSADGEDMIREIIATGNVVIKFDDKIAISEKAVYTASTGVIVLSGPDSKVTSGKDSVSGEKITLYRADDRMLVESSSEARVEAVFYSEDKNKAGN